MYALRSRLVLLRGERALEDRVRTGQENQLRHAGGTQRELAEENVWMRGYGKQEKWLKGNVTGRLGSRSYVVDKGGGLVDQIRRHSGLSEVPCLEKNTDSTSESEGAVQPSGDEVVDESSASPDKIESIREMHRRELAQPSCNIDTGASPKHIDDSTFRPSSTPPFRRSHPVRERKPVVRFGFENN